MYFKNSPEYEARLRQPFSPTNVTYKEIHEAVPKEVLKKSPWKATCYVLRDFALIALFYKFAYSITPWAASDFGGFVTTAWKKTALKSALWMTYWWFQGLVGAGLFILGHEAGHTTLYHSKTMNDIVGFLVHTYILVPYFSWKFSHNLHHKATASMERDENYIPFTRTDYGLPKKDNATLADYSKVFEETPIVTLGRMLAMQILGWWAYLTQNALGSPAYPKGTNHFNPDSALFKKGQRNHVIASNIGVGAMAAILCYLGLEFVLWFYLVPYLLLNHWIVMFTFLQHSDPTVPHYRQGEWTFVRGAAATVDRPLLGAIGSFFFHNATHNHVAHHFFSRSPFFNGPQITEALKTVLKDDYYYDSTPTFYALYRSFTECVFVEDEGDILFYKNKQGVAARKLAQSEDEHESKKEVNPRGYPELRAQVGTNH